MGKAVLGYLFTVILLISACGIVSPNESVGSENHHAQVSEDQSSCVIGEPPLMYSFHPFYEKYCDANGIPIISSTEVEDRALQQAFYLITNMLAPTPELRRRLVSQGAYFAIIGIDEEQTTHSEYAHMDSEFWDKRARGLGGSIWKPLTSGAEENLICFRRDRYYSESTPLHEFAHTIHLLGLGLDSYKFNAKLDRLYQSALEQRLWINTYAGSEVKEYRAEGVQPYFNTNMETNPPDGIHNHVDTRQELASYDPELYQFISRFFNGFEWTPICPGLMVNS
jgi:hypothetical protein